MTYRELLKALKELTSEQLKMKVSVVHLQGDEFALDNVNDTMLASEVTGLDAIAEEEFVACVEPNQPLLVVKH